MFGTLVMDDSLTIKELPPNLQPRERLIENGVTYLSDSELIAILLGTGTRDKTALRLAELLISYFKDISLLSVARHSQLVNMQGIGKAKAAQVIAAFELGRRAVSCKPSKQRYIGSPEDVWQLLGPSMRLLDKEYFKSIFLDTKHNIIGVCDISVGSLNASIVHPRELFKEAIKQNSSQVIVVHNHPSGSTRPSNEDVELTKRLVKAGELIGIQIIDHIIIGIDGFVSLKERGLV